MDRADARVHRRGVRGRAPSSGRPPSLAAACNRPSPLDIPVATAISRWERPCSRLRRSTSRIFRIPCWRIPETVTVAVFVSRFECQPAPRSSAIGARCCRALVPKCVGIGAQVRRNRCPGASESVPRSVRNRCPSVVGIGAQVRSEYADSRSVRSGCTGESIHREIATCGTKTKELITPFDFRLAGGKGIHVVLEATDVELRSSIFD